MVQSSLASPSTLSTTISQVAAKNPAVGMALARASVSASLLSSLTNGASSADLPGTPNSLADPTLQIVEAVNAHLGQNFNVTI